jgi:dTDP-4-amino-4,6-dideoxygalactose transaminase
MIPSIGTPIGVGDLWKGLFGEDPDLVEVFKRYAGIRHCYFVNSGTTAFYLILRALKTLSKRRKVVLPAYTAPSLILPIRKAGLEPALSEVSLETFNVDVERLGEYVDEETLCVLPVHMFGVPCDMAGVEKVARSKGAFVVEDAASSLGSELDGRPTGTFGDVGFYSFNRGKNLTTLTGGCIITDSDRLAQLVEKEVGGLPKSSVLSRALIPGKTAVLALAVRPLVYTLLYPIVARFKYTELHTEFDSFACTKFQARMGTSLFRRVEETVFRRREENGVFLYTSLTGIEGIRLPENQFNSEEQRSRGEIRNPQSAIRNRRVVFNQFPLLFEEEAVRDTLHRKIRKELKIETTILYPDPIHKIYDLGYDLNRDPFPNATYLARRLLLIPTHPLIRRKMLEEIVDLVKEHMDLHKEPRISGKGGH